MNRRSFIPGQEWLFVKIYCGLKTADDLIGKRIFPISNKLLSQGLIKKWFFIRYNDPDFHIRFRLNLVSIDCFGDVVKELNSCLAEFIENELIWKISFDTYNRELERYKPELIQEAESLFFFDSLCCGNFLKSFVGLNNDKLRYLFAFKSIDVFLSDFDYTIEKKCELLFELRKAFYNEFSVRKETKLSLDKKYRLVKKDINSILELYSENLSGDENTIIQILKTRSMQSRVVVDNVLIFFNNDYNSINKVMASYIHMLMNRLFRSQQRLHELVIYDFLWRSYNSEIAKGKKALSTL